MADQGLPQLVDALVDRVAGCSAAWNIRRPCGVVGGRAALHEDEVAIDVSHGSVLAYRRMLRRPLARRSWERTPRRAASPRRPGRGGGCSASSFLRARGPSMPGPL